MLIRKDLTIRKIRRRRRLFIRIALLLLATGMLWPLVPGANLSHIIPAISPYVVINSILATRTFYSIAWLGLTFGILALVSPRFICRWICPVGLCNDTASDLGKRLGRKALRIPSLGRWFVWLTLGGSLLGYSIFLWMDPLSIFANIPSFVKHTSEPGSWIPVIAFFLIVLVNVIWPHLYCTRLCPLGATQDIFGWLRKTFQSLVKRLNTDQEIKKGRSERLSRRLMIGVSGGALLTWMIRPVLAKKPQAIRPPGAQKESVFVGTCTRCGSCQRVCPSNIIERDLGQNAFVSLLTPVLNFEEEYCREDCIKCTEACPSGALIPLSLENKPHFRMGLPEVYMDKCLLAFLLECSACQDACFYDAVIYEFSYDTYSLSVKVDPQKCNGCGACELECPASPEKAIIVQPIREESSNSVLEEQ